MLARQVEGDLDVGGREGQTVWVERRVPLLLDAVRVETLPEVPLGI